MTVMEVYRVEDDNMTRIDQTDLDTEAALETRLVRARGAEIGGVELLYVSRQNSPGEAGIFDILAVDEDGNVVVVELKRDRAPRRIVAQALEYASEVRKEDYDNLNSRYRQFLQDHYEDEAERQSLADAHAEYFELDEPLSPREFNADQRLILVGRGFGDVSLSMADFLREHDIDVICVEYRAYATEKGDLEILTTDGIRRPLSAEPDSTSGSTSTKNYEDYSAVIQAVRDRIHPQISDSFGFDSPEDIANNNQKRNLKIKSNHPDHPDELMYGMSPRISEDGLVKFGVSVWDAEDDLRREIYDVLQEHLNGLEGYEIVDDQLKSVRVVRKRVPVDSADGTLSDREVDTLADELLSLATHYHPQMIDRFGTESE